jgi:hypothetical protein
MRQVKLARQLGFEIGTPVITGTDARTLGDRQVDWDTVGWVEQFLIWKEPNNTLVKPLLVRWGAHTEPSAHFSSELWIVDYETNKPYDPWRIYEPSVSYLTGIPCHYEELNASRWRK